MQNSKKEKIEAFNPSCVGNTSANIFGLPFDFQESQVIIFPVPWDVTASNLAGSSNAPEYILRNSPQINLYNSICPDAWKAGIFMEDIPQHILKLNKQLQSKVNIYRQFIQNGGDVEKNLKMISIQDEINKASAGVANEVEFYSKRILSEGKFPAVLGGDHSTPFGLIKALTTKYTDFGILQIDAHNDLYECYEGLDYSHASIFYNVLSLKELNKIVQVGVREISHEESRLIEKSSDKIKLFHNDSLKEQLFKGYTWDKICNNIISELPEKVYVSFDIDGLEPSNCPSTGTPVPGGLSYDQAMYLLDMLVKSNRTLIGFDLVEVVPGKSDIDTIIASRILYKLSVIMIKTNSLI